MTIHSRKRPPKKRFTLRPIHGDCLERVGVKNIGGGYIAEYGTSSWELDALEPSVLDNIVKTSILENLDIGLYREKEREEQNTKARLLSYAKAF